MSNYWAKFEKIGNNMFRFDTRIYIEPITSPSTTDVCIGAVVGKNPGSAKAKDLTNTALQQIDLAHDKLLPNILSIVKSAYKKAGKNTDKNSYIQILNLFYLCNPKLKDAVKEIQNYSKPIVCNSEKLSYPWVWYVWGNGDITLSKFKERFGNLKTKNHFFFNQNTRSIKESVPTPSDFARHTQGLSHDLIIPYLSKIILQ